MKKASAVKASAATKKVKAKAPAVATKLEKAPAAATKPEKVLVVARRPVKALAAATSLKAKASAAKVSAVASV